MHYGNIGADGCTVVVLEQMDALPADQAHGAICHQFDVPTFPGCAQMLSRYEQVSSQRSDLH